MVEKGKITKLFPHSGHYRPGEVHMFYLLHFLQAKGVVLSELLCDAQRLARVARKKESSKSMNMNIKINTCIYIALFEIVE